jgi:hypothetical protein
MWISSLRSAGTSTTPDAVEIHDMMQAMYAILGSSAPNLHAASDLDAGDQRRSTA